MKIEWRDNVTSLYPMRERVSRYGKIRGVFWSADNVVLYARHVPGTTAESMMCRISDACDADTRAHIENLARLHYAEFFEEEG